MPPKKMTKKQVESARESMTPTGTSRLDGWTSALNGIGTTTHDKRQATTFSADWVNNEAAVELWRGDDIAARIIETVPNEMFRQGYEIRIEDDSKGLQDRVLSKLEELGVNAALWDGLCYEGAYGGGAILLGANDGQDDLSKPLNLATLREFNWLTALEPRELMPIKWYSNPQAPKFGQPAVYQLTPISPGAGIEESIIASKSTQQIHESRLIIFPGIKVSRRQLNTLGGWGDSRLSRVIRVLRDFNISWAAAAILTNDFSQAIFKMKGLAELIATDRDQVVKNRMLAVEMSRSIARAIMIDADNEEFERKTTPIQGLPELLDRFSTRLAAAADIPLTLLMGQSPAGLNATGESDIRFFYDRVKVQQDRKLRPALERLVTLIMATESKAPANWSIHFHPLWQPTEKERAEARKIQMETDTGYIAAQVLSPEEVAVSRFGGDEFSFETNIETNNRKPVPIAIDPNKVKVNAKP